jgi:8-oxo-dGTP pyrophosphatase MutT (NUDIX family)
MPEPRPSATVVLLRDNDESPEILLVRRRAGDAFGDSYTFPGGVLDDDEAAARNYCSGLASHDADALLGVESGGLVVGRFPARTRTVGSLRYAALLHALDYAIGSPEALDNAIFPRGDA